MDLENLERIIDATVRKEEEESEKSLRPHRFEEYMGQEEIKKNLKVFIQAAKQRQEPLDHILFYGPPGLGKTTLAGIIIVLFLIVQMISEFFDTVKTLFQF